MDPTNRSTASSLNWEKSIKYLDMNKNRYELAELTKIKDLLRIKLDELSLNPNLKGRNISQKLIETLNTYEQHQLKECDTLQDNWWMQHRAGIISIYSDMRLKIASSENYFKGSGAEFGTNKKLINMFFNRCLIEHKITKSQSEKIYDKREWLQLQNATEAEVKKQTKTMLRCHHFAFLQLNDKSGFEYSLKKGDTAFQTNTDLKKIEDFGYHLVENPQEG